MGRKPRGDVLVFEGRRYTWTTKGYWRCTTSSDRHNLARLVWERANGPIPSGCKVFFRDGNRYNVAASNLECLSQAEVQKRRMADTDKRAMATCRLAYGRLIFSIAIQSDHQLGRSRSLKAWATRRHRYGAAGGN